MEDVTDITGVEVSKRAVITEGDPENGEAIGIFAYADLTFKTRAGGWYVGPTVRTPGVWGITEDDDFTAEKYAHDTYGEEETELLDEMLLALNVKPR